MTDSIRPASKPGIAAQFAAPLRLVAIGVVRVASLGLAAWADQMEERGKA